ncbi:MAG: MBL fold metallo-hydrolase [Ruminococcus sp.]|nr:MBL fold metallo-hydrolase [Ruminococcus sp.]
MARIYPLFSSSKGNCTYLGDAYGGLLVDCGVSCKRVCDAFTENGLVPDAVKAVFITHTHSDHISGLKVFLKKYPVPVYASSMTLRVLGSKGVLPEGHECHEVDSGRVTAWKFIVRAFPTPHDCPGSCCYQFTYPDGKTAAVCTDLGVMTDEIYEGLRGSRLILLESNYDADMLRNGRYPADLKARIAGGWGHLSNNACGENMMRFFRDGTVHFVLGHLSEENNTPQLAERSAVEAMQPLRRERDYAMYIAPPCGGKAVVF